MVSINQYAFRSIYTSPNEHNQPPLSDTIEQYNHTESEHMNHTNHNYI